MKKIKKNIQSSATYLLISKPNHYLKKLFLKTILIGFITISLIVIMHFFELESIKIPSTMHSLIGIVIGLLLVFRTTTAYERWWEGRKTIGLLSAEVGILSSKIDVLKNENNKEKTIYLKKCIENFLTDLSNYLELSDNGQESKSFHLSQKVKIQKSAIALRDIELDNSYYQSIDNSLYKMLEFSNSLERIKNTPIPLSYVLHIKVSIMIYLMTLPFGLFHDLGIWATPIVMVVYYIIAGVEIISNEIENPFAGEPNDLPVKKLFSSMIDTLLDKKN